MKFKTVIILLFSFSIFAQGTDKIGGYLFAHMTSDDYGTLHYSISKDGLQWNSLRNGKRILEDYKGHPDIITGHDGKFYLVGNPKEEGNKIRIWTSTDLLNWTFLTDLKPDMSQLPEFDSKDYWHGAPKMFYDMDTNKYIITWHFATKNRNKVSADEYWGSMRTLFVTSTNLKEISMPKRLFDKDFATIDVIIRKFNNSYYAILKDERAPSQEHPTGKSIRMAKATSLEGPYSAISPSISPNFREAPTLIPQRNGKGYYLYFEQYPGIQYEMAIATDIEGPWYDGYANSFSIPKEARHGCMLPLTKAQFEKLNSTLGDSNDFKNQSNWLYVGFKDPGDKGLWFSTSEDGYVWNELNNGKPWVNPAIGMNRMRDPFIARDPRQGFHLLWTIGNQKMGYAHSNDLVHWSAPQTIPVLTDNPNVQNVWAPEMFYDQATKKWFVYWSSTIKGEFPETVGQVKNDKNHRIYYMTTDDFKNFSKPAIFYNPGFPVIDATILKEADTFYMVVKDERDIPLKKNLRMTSAKSILGPWSELSEPITGSWTEGPSLFKKDDTYVLYFDHYNGGKGMQALESKNLKDWKDISTKVQFAPESKHGSFVKITSEEFNALKRAEF
jgi:hypothetical protein